MTKRKSLIARAAIGMAAIGALALTGCTAATNDSGANPSSAGSDGDACAFFEGKTVEFLIPYGPGGGYDILARILIPGLENALDARVLPINKPGAGGLLAINELSTQAPDGTTIGIVNGTGLAGALLAGAEGPAFGFDDLSYIGRAAVDDLVVVTNANGEYQTWEDIAESENFRFGSTGRGSSDYIVGNALIRAFELNNAEVIAGFTSQPEIELAIIQNNVEAIVSPIDSRRPGLVSGETTAVLSFADEAPEEAPDATLFSDLDLSDDAEGIIDGVKLLTQLGRSLVAPAGMDEERLSCLRGALEAAMEDPEVVDQAANMQFALSYLSGEEVESDVIDEYESLSDEFIEILKASY